MMKFSRVAILPILLAVLLVGCARHTDLTIDQLAAVAERDVAARPVRIVPATRPATLPATRSAVLPKIEPKPVVGEDRPVVALGLQDCLLRALANSLAIRVEGYNPAILAQDVIAAEAVFDAVFFTEASVGETNERSFSAFEASSELRSSQTAVKAGLRQRLPIGLNLEAFYQTSRTTTSSVFAGLSPQWDNDLVIAATLNLARGAGREVNEAQIEISKRAREIGDEAFRGQVMTTVNEVVIAYWRLIQARRTHAILRELVDATQKTYDTVKARRRLDASNVNIKNAEASLNQRKVLLVRAKAQIESAEDVLVNLLNDSDLPLDRNFGIVPTDELVIEKFMPDRTAAVEAAMNLRSELRQAALAVAAARTAVTAAKNNRLPVVDLALQWSQNGTDGTWSDGNDAMFSDSLYDWLLSLKIEMPVGNRAANAEHRKRSLELAQAKKKLRKTREDVILHVNQTVRELDTSYREIQLQAAATRSARESLDAIIQRMEKRGDYSPSFLDLRLNAEAQWITAKRTELDTITNYNTAIANYLHATGRILTRNSIHLRRAGTGRNSRN